jgi:hypothetical protein
MVNSPIPADHEIRVLVVIRNGVVISEDVLPENMLIGTLDELVNAAIQAGRFHDLADSAKG